MSGEPKLRPKHGKLSTGNDLDDDQSLIKSFSDCLKHHYHTLAGVLGHFDEEPASVPLIPEWKRAVQGIKRRNGKLRVFHLTLHS